MKATSSVRTVMHNEAHKLGGKVNGCTPQVCKTALYPDVGEQIVCESVCLLCTLHVPSPQLEQSVRSVCKTFRRPVVLLSYFGSVGRSAAHAKCHQMVKYCM